MKNKEKCNTMVMQRKKLSWPNYNDNIEDQCMFIYTHYIQLNYALFTIVTNKIKAT